MRIVLIGFGNVGQGFAEILRDYGEQYRRALGFRPLLVGVATRSRGVVYHPDGLDPAALLDAIASGSLHNYPDGASLLRLPNADALIATAAADVLIEASPSDLQTAQPALHYCEQAMARGWHVVVANKGVVVQGYASLSALARQHGRQFRFEATVMAGTPTMMLGLDALAGAGITRLRGILNGTTNYILTHMESGMSYAAALAEAQRLGYAETDPTADVDGWDAAGKAVILARTLFGANVTLADFHVQGIRGISATDMALAHEAGATYKLIATVTPQGGNVQPVRVPLDDPLASVKGATNAITFSTTLLGDVTLIGAGAGRVQTGYALVADLLALR